jgi:ketosteroid isomerase-like protein
MRSILLILLVVALPAMAQEPDSSSALFKMRDAERHFAQNSVMHGRNAAFVESFAGESVIFTDKWITSGKQFWKERKEAAVVLKWEPEFMDIAGSRDFGISTGPWEMQEYRPNTSPLYTGYFLTVWKKKPGGVWQVILDAGSGTPPPEENVHSFSFPKGADRTVPDIKIKASVKNELPDIENQMANAWKNNSGLSTYTSFLARDARIQNNGHLPTINRDTINKFISQLNKDLTWKTSGSGIATSGDLGFTYGYLFTKGVQDKPSGHYVRIWKKQSDEKWAIAIDMLSLD